ncbi:Hypothetical predicted protein, partial [Paramuricea clavata]
HAASYWTGWLDRDNPSGTGDWETYRSFKKAPCHPGYKPIDAKCRVKYGKAPWYKANEEIPAACYRCTPTGFACKNADQPDRRCKDYEIQFLCYRRH